MDFTSVFCCEVIRNDTVKIYLYTVYIIFYFIILYYIIFYYITLYYIILGYIILYYIVSTYHNMHMYIYILAGDLLIASLVGR